MAYDPLDKATLAQIKKLTLQVLDVCAAKADTYTKDEVLSVVSAASETTVDQVMDGLTGTF